MSATQSNISRVQRDIESLNQKLYAERKKEAERTGKILDAEKALSRSTSTTTIQSKLREIERYRREILDCQKREAEYTRQLADKTARLHSYQQQAGREQGKEQQKLLDSLKQQQTALAAERAALLRTAGRAPATASPNPEAVRDAFVSHASEDKDDIVRPLVEKLVEAGFSIWYDEYELTVGDSLRRSIDRGLANARFGIVVLSPHFFAKNWTQYELDGLVAREIGDGGKVILPLWHKVTKDEVRGYSPSLADKVALNTAVQTLDEIVGELTRAMRRGS